MDNKMSVLYKHDCEIYIVDPNDVESNYDLYTLRKQVQNELKNL